MVVWTSTPEMLLSRISGRDHPVFSSPPTFVAPTHCRSLLSSTMICQHNQYNTFVMFDEVDSLEGLVPLSASLLVLMCVSCLTSKGSAILRWRSYPPTSLTSGEQFRSWLWCADGYLDLFLLPFARRAAQQLHFVELW